MWAGIDAKVERVLASRDPDAARALVMDSPRFVKMKDGYLLKLNCDGTTVVSATRLNASTGFGVVSGSVAIVAAFRIAYARYVV